MQDRYVFDTCAFIVIGHYFPSAFPSFWKVMNKYVKAGNIFSVREVANELENNNTEPHLANWKQNNKTIFRTPGDLETTFVAEIFKIPKFQELIRKKELQVGRPVADPFIIAAAKVHDAWVVTQEKFKPNGARIPNVCRHFKVGCIDVQGLMKRENWSF